MSHERAAKSLGIAHETLQLECGGAKKWRARSELDWTRVEEAALDHYRADGWRGYSGEGGLVLNLIKAAAFPNLPERHRATYTEALFSGNIAAHLQFKFTLDDLLGCIELADLDQIIRVFRAMSAPRSSLGLDNSMLDFFPHLREWHFLELFEHLGRERLRDIAEVFGRDPYEYRKGWPDLTLWRDGEVIFKEVKAPGDQLHASQRKTIRDVLIPLGYSVSIVDVVHADPDATTTK